MIEYTKNKSGFEKVSEEGFTADEIRFLRVCCANLGPDLTAEVDLYSSREELLLGPEELDDFVDQVISGLLKNHIKINLDDGSSLKLSCFVKTAQKSSENVALKMDPGVFELLQNLVTQKIEWPVIH